jgi:hypothetical protein
MPLKGPDHVAAGNARASFTLVSIDRADIMIAENHIIRRFEFFHHLLESIHIPWLCVFGEIPQGQNKMEGLNWY